jgi:branched-chain amino acid transport system ATP-binding protein
VDSGESVFLTQDLRKHFGGVRAVDGVSIQVRQGEFRALIGPNGAGKSTFFNVATGLIKCDQGKVFFQGQDITGEPPHALYRKRISRTFQITSIFADLTVQENVQVALLSHERRTLDLFRWAGTMAVQRALELLELVGLAAEQSRTAGILSHGDQKRLELAVALANDPRLLLLDEPTAGMAAQERFRSIQLIHRIAKELGLTVIFTEHDMDVVFAVADVITVLHQGRVLAEGVPAEVRANDEVQRVYLGEGG